MHAGTHDQVVEFQGLNNLRGYLRKKKRNELHFLNPLFVVFILAKGVHQEGIRYLEKAM